jgi:hypothetical protein
MAWSSQQSRRDWERRAGAYVATLMAEPDPKSVERLARLGDRDIDHSRWELRYLRRALGLLVAGRDALDDQTASEVGKALAQAVDHDPSAAPAMRAISAAQFNSRLRAYREALGVHGPMRVPAGKVAESLASFAGGRADAIATQWLTPMVLAEFEQCHEALRQAFGEAELPDDLSPSEAARRR